MWANRIIGDVPGMLILFQRFFAIIWLALVCFETMPMVVYQWTTVGESCTACSDHSCACSVGKVPLEACCCAGMFAEEAEESSHTPELLPIGAFCGDDGDAVRLLRLGPILLTSLDAPSFLPDPIETQYTAMINPPLVRLGDPPDKIPIA